MKYKNIEVFLALVRAGLWMVKGEGFLDEPSGKAERTVHGFSGVDWEEVYRLAEEQSVDGLLAAGIDNLNLDVPLELKLNIIGEALQIEQRNNAMNEFVARLLSHLRKEGIYAVLVKGQGIAQCYEKPLWRASGDVDLLLDAENYEKAKVSLVPLATDIEREEKLKLHQAFAVGQWEVELHGTLRGTWSERVDRVVDEVQADTFDNGHVRVWKNGEVDVILPSCDNDIIFVFTHILQHFFLEGIGLRQVCDWCRLMWTYRDKLDLDLLESRLQKMGLMREWRSFAALAVDWLGMPEEAMPLYSSARKWRRKAQRIVSLIIETGNFGHNRDMSYKQRDPFFVRIVKSFWRHTKDGVKQFIIFPIDSLMVWMIIVRMGTRVIVNKLR